jgi:hypothetical protein
MQLLLLSALLATLSRLTGFLRRLLVLLLVLLTGLLLATALLTTTLAALLVLLAVPILIVVVHGFLQIFCEVLFECHHSTNPL